VPVNYRVRVARVTAEGATAAGAQAAGGGDLGKMFRDGVNSPVFLKQLKAAGKAQLNSTI